MELAEAAERGKGGRGMESGDISGWENRKQIWPEKGFLRIMCGLR